MKRQMLAVCLALAGAAVSAAEVPLGLPPVPIPEDNPQTPEKVALGDKLFHDQRFSIDGTVSCATCHDRNKGFTDQLKVSKGHSGKLGTRNSPTVINSAYVKPLFWDGREPTLEAQAAQPPINPVEGGLENHEPILKIVRTDPEYAKAFKQVFDKQGKDVSMREVTQAIAAFERTVIAGNSPFDRFQYGGDVNALNEVQKRGLEVYLGQGRCVSCHAIEETHALFTDNRFHSIGIGFTRVQGDIDTLAEAFLDAKAEGVDVDIAVLTNPTTSELGRFAVDDRFVSVQAFKTPTLRNIAATAPYMHDGSLETLEDVVDFYNNGGRVKETDPVSPFLSGGIRPLDLSDQQKKDLVEFMKALTSPEFEQAVNVANR